MTNGACEHMRDVFMHAQRNEHLDSHVNTCAFKSAWNVNDVHAFTHRVWNGMCLSQVNAHVRVNSVHTDASVIICTSLWHLYFHNAIRMHVGQFRDCQELRTKRARRFSVVTIV